MSPVTDNKVMHDKMASTIVTIHSKKSVITISIQKVAGYYKFTGMCIATIL